MGRFYKWEKTLKFPAETEEIIELDAGEEMTGYLKTEFCHGKGSKVQFLYSEAYVQNGFTGPEKSR
ncbi:hypothetical protein LC724_00350 [Blautia sp. RD014234]|nr:hypothetical protein [Blautia parvula]